MLRRVITGEWLTILGGYASAFGLLLIVLAFRLRAMRREVEGSSAGRAARA